jgi:hypothetical protein
MKASSKNITFTLSVDEANKIFKALGALPFSEVYELIGKLNEQANSQLSQGEPKSANGSGNAADSSLRIK